MSNVKITREEVPTPIIKVTCERHPELIARHSWGEVSSSNALVVLGGASLTLRKSELTEWCTAVLEMCRG